MIRSGRFAHVVCLSLCLTSSAQAQSIPADGVWKNKQLANKLSYLTVGLSLGLDTIRNHDKRSLINQGVRVGITIGVSELVKHLVPRTRPDGSDNLSFYSEHTALSATNLEWKYNLPLSFSTGYLRVAANKHYFTDVLTGAAVGFTVKELVK